MVLANAGRRDANVRLASILKAQAGDEVNALVEFKAGVSSLLLANSLHECAPTTNPHAQAADAAYN
jgi:hypothetical protein